METRCHVTAMPAFPLPYSHLGTRSLLLLKYGKEIRN